MAKVEKWIDQQRKMDKLQYEIKILKLYQWVCFVLAIYSWAWYLSKDVVKIHNETPLERTNFSFASRHQLHMLLFVRIETCAHLSLYALGLYLAWTCVSPVKASTESVRSYACKYCCIWKAQFPWVCVSFALHNRLFILLKKFVYFLKTSLSWLVQLQYDDFSLYRIIFCYVL